MKKTSLFGLTSYFLLFTFYLCSSQPMDKARFRYLFEQGNRMMLEHYYDTASRTFLILQKTDPSNANINYKIGVCYLNIPTKKSKAAGFLENAVKQTKGTYVEDDVNEKNAPENAFYYLGQAYHYIGRFDDGIAQFKKFRELVGKWNLALVKEIDHWIETSNNAKTLLTKPVECTITNLSDSINSEYPDYSPVISADESALIFTSRREGTGGAANKTPDDAFFEDIWISFRQKYGTWSKAKNISRSINTIGHEATVGLSADGQQLYIYRDDAGDGNIYLSKLEGDSWEEPIKINGNNNVNSKFWEPSACISADGNTLYFASNRKDGLGGRDIYECHRQHDGTWGQPENLGPAINTPYEEDAPFIHPDGVTLFFSSTGHNSMGGFDVFYSTKVAKNVWTAPTNMGYPINTVDDDIYFVTSSDGRRAYYSSIRPEGKGEKDIYMITLPEPFVKSTSVLVGYLKNRDNSPISPNSFVYIKSEKGSTVVCKANEMSGKFIQSLLPKQTYEISIEVNEKNIFREQFYLPEDSSYQNLGRGFFQRTIYIGDTAHIFAAVQKTDTVSQITIVPMEGKILLGTSPPQPAAGVSAQLLNDQGDLIASAVTDSSGYFKIQNLSSTQEYILKINENDTILKTQNKFFLADKNNNVIASTSKESHFFLFQNLPADFSKLKPIEAIDVGIPKVVMKGRIVTADKTGKKSITINLMDENQKILQTKITDKSGGFSFENLSPNKNYSIALNADDPVIKNYSALYLANPRDEIVKKLSKVADYFVYERLPADLNTLSPIEITDIKESPLTTSFTKAGTTSSDLTALPDEAFDFVVYFPYNKKEINPSVGSFLSLMEKVNKTLVQEGSVTIRIIGSSSAVPTKSFPSNESLARARAEEIKDKVRSSMSLKNLDDSKINYDIAVKVQGPAYKNDAMQNRKEYEKWQYVKVIVE